MSSGFALIVLAIEFVAIASAIHALFTVRTAQGTVAWVIGLIAFPWLGLPLYWFFGSRRFEAHSRAMQAKLRDHSDRIDAISRAKRCIYVQFYIMRPDGLGRRLLQALSAKAAEGVEVCFLIDSVGGASMTPAIIREWRARGVRIIAFSASSSWRDRWRLNFRNHRKNVIVDGQVGFIGGHNVGDEYLGLDPKYGRWRDTHVRVEGPSALQLQMVFVADWYFTTGELLDAPWQPRALAFEITLAVTDARFAAEVAAMFEKDLLESTEVGPRAYEDLAFPLKVGAKVARLLAPVL